MAGLTYASQPLATSFGAASEAPASIPVEGWGGLAKKRALYRWFRGLPSGEFAGRTPNDWSSMLVTYAINIFQSAMAIVYHAHPIETISRNVLTRTTNETTLNTLRDRKDSRGINFMLFNLGFHNSELAFVSLKRTTPLGRWWNRSVQVPFQKQFGIRGNVNADVLPPSGLTKRGLKWNDLKQNPISQIEDHRYQGLAGKRLVAHLAEVFTQVLDGVVNDPQQAVEEVGNHTFVLYDTLGRRLQPKETLNNSLGDILDDYRVERHRLVNDVGEEARRRLQARVSSLVRLYTQLPSAKEDALTRWLDRVEDTVATGASLKPLQQELLNNLNQEWEQAIKQPVQQVVATVRQHFQQALQEAAKEENDNQRLGKLAHACQQLIRVGTDEQTGKPCIQGKIPDLLDPLFNLNERAKTIDAFLMRRNAFLAAQTALMALVECLVVGNFIMWAVFKFFAPLDADFNPEDFNKNHRKHRVNHPAQSTLATTSNAATTAASSAANQLSNPALSARSVVAPPASPTLIPHENRRVDWAPLHGPVLLKEESAHQQLAAANAFQRVNSNPPKASLVLPAAPAALASMPAPSPMRPTLFQPNGVDGVNGTMTTGNNGGMGATVALPPWPAPAQAVPLWQLSPHELEGLGA